MRVTLIKELTKRFNVNRWEGSTVEGQQFETGNKETYGFTYNVNSSSVRIQNQYNETIVHWSVLAIIEITINYTIK